MMEFKNKKSGMMLAEVMFAILICSIILGVAVMTLKSHDTKRTPYLMSVLKNISEANSVVMHNCHEDGTCQNENQLPDSIVEYCIRLADTFMTSGDSYCSSADSNIQNFKMTNGVSYFDFNIADNQDWHKNNSEYPKNYIDIVADINNSKSPNTNLSDRFAFRIFKNGEIVPSVMDNVQLYEREDLFAYKVFINKAEIDSNGKVNSKIRVIEPVDTRTKEEIDEKIAFNQKISFKRAVCMAHGVELLQRYYGTEVSCDGDEHQRLLECNFDAENNSTVVAGDNTAFCFVKPVKPSGKKVF